MGKDLLNAAKKGNIANVKSLLEQNLSIIEYTDNDGDSVLNNAAWKGQFEVVKLLVQMGAMLEHKNKNELNALHHAACKGRTEVARYLIKKGINVNSRTKKGTTPLIMAARNGQTETVRALLEMGANKDAEDNSRDTALKAAQEKNQTETIRLLQNWKDRRSQGEELWAAAKKGDLAEVKRLVENGAPLEHQDKDLDSVLNNAAWKGHTKVVEYLVQQGARLESPNQNNLTALHHASYKGHFDTAEWLIKAGCNVNARSHKGNTPLIMAAKNGLTSTCRTLIEYGADINATNKDNDIAYDVALKNEKAETYKFLSVATKDPAKYGPKSRVSTPTQAPRSEPPQPVSVVPVPNEGLSLSTQVEVKQPESPNPGLMAARSAHRAATASETRQQPSPLKMRETINIAYQWIGKYRKEIDYFQKKAPELKYHAFISKCHEDALDVCASIKRSLTDQGLAIWLDMENAELNIVGIIKGIAHCGNFLLFATAGYLQQPLGHFELLVAMKLEKPIHVVWDSDSRHCGFREFRDFAEKLPEDYKSDVLDQQSIKWERREPFKTNVILSKLVPRLDEQMPLSTWTPQKVGGWISALGKAFEKYGQIFVENCLDGKEIKSGNIVESDLLDLGVKKVHAKIILSKLLAVGA